MPCWLFLALLAVSFWLFLGCAAAAVFTVFEDFDCQFAIVSKLKQATATARQQLQQSQQLQRQQQQQQQHDIGNISQQFVGSASDCEFCQLARLFLRRFYFAMKRLLLCGLVIAARANTRNAQL